MKKLILAAGLMAATTINHAATFTGELDGTYTFMDGYIQTREVGTPDRPEQLGSMIMYFLRDNWRSLPYADQFRVRRLLVIEGQLRGLVNTATFMTQHVVVNENSSGALYTQDDVLIPTSGDPFCSSGTPIKGWETINMVGGSGEYQNLESGQLKLRAEVNNCPGMDNYGINFFSPVRGQGGTLIFKSRVN